MKRTDRYRLLFGAILTLMVLMVVGAFFLVRSPWFQGQARALVVERLSRSLGMEIEMERFRAGLGVARIEGVRVLEDVTPQPRPLFSAGAIGLRFNLLSMLLGRESLLSMVLENPIFWIYGSREEGGAGEGFSLVSIPPMDVRRLVVSSGRIYAIRGDTLIIDDIDLNGRVSVERSGLEVNLTKASFQPVLPNSSPVGLSGRLWLTAGRIDSLRIVTDVGMSRVMSAGWVDLENGIADISFILRPLRLPDVGLWYPKSEKWLTGSLTGNGRLQGSLKDPELTADLLVSRTKILDRAVDSLRVSVRLDSSGIKLTDMRLTDEETSISGVLDAGFGGEGLELDGIFQFRGLNPAGWTSAVPEGLSAELNGRVEINAGGRDSSDFGLSGRVVLEDGVAAGYRFQGCAAEFDYRQERLTIDRLEILPSGDADARINARGYVGVGGMSLEVVLDHIALGNLGDRAGTGELGGFISGRSNIFGQPDDPNLIATLDLTDLVIGPLRASQANLNLNLDRLRSEKRGRVELLGREVELGGIPMESVRLRAGGHLQAIDLESLELRISPDYLVEASGQAALFPNRLNLELARISAQLKGQVVGNTESALVSIFPDKVDIQSLAVFHGSGTADLRGVVEPSGRSDLQVNLKNLDLEAIGLALGWTENVSGHLTLGAEIVGDLSRPALAVNGLIERPSFRAYDFDRVGGAFSYRSGRVTIDSLSLVRDSTEIMGWGEIPFSAFPMPGERIGDRSLSFDILGRKVPLVLVNELTKSVEFREGVGELAFSASGRLPNPELDGEFVFDGARLFVPSIDTEFEAVAGEVTLSPQGLELTSISGPTAGRARRGKGGISGRITMPGFDSGGLDNEFTFEHIRQAFRPDSLSLDFTAEDIRMTNIPDIDGWVSTSDLHLVGPVAKPLLSGRLRAVEGTISIPFGETRKPDRAVREVESDLDVDISVMAENNVWFKNDEANVELSGEIGVKLIDRRITLSGQMETIRGTYTLVLKAPTRTTALGRDLQLYTRDFNITRGMIMFREDPEINPELDFEAQLGRASGNTEIELELSGTVKNPEYRLFSRTDPDLSENDIYSILLFDTPIEELQALKSGSEGDLAAYGGTLSDELKFKAVNVVENLVAQQMQQEIGLDTIRLDTDLFSAERDVTVTAGKYISRRLFLSGSASLQGETSGLMEYFLNRNTSFIGEVDNLGDYNVYIKYRIRY
ncbi:translocation/assembly module TamB domain-containing protein [candidate division KSB1 bacterium]